MLFGRLSNEPASNLSMRTAAARGSVSTSASGRNNPSKQWLGEIDGIQKLAALGTGNSCGRYSTMTRDGRDLD
jgi:hypothetical protein